MMHLITIVVSVFYFIRCGASQTSEPIHSVFWELAEYNKTYQIVLNSSVEYILGFQTNENNPHSKFYPSRVSVSCENGSQDYPLFVTTTQQKGILSWQLPMIVETPFYTQDFHHVSRTLCPKNTNFSQNDTYGAIITLSTPKPDNITATLRLEQVLDFYVELNVEKNLTITPSEPQYYFFSFDFNKSVHDDSTSKHLQMSDRMRVDMDISELSESVILLIESDDDICAVISIQNNSCPTFDNEREILYEGYYLTMMRKGGITLTKSVFPTGFHVVFIVKETDVECLGESSLRKNSSEDVNHSFWEHNYKLKTNNERIKNLRFRIVKTIAYEDYLLAGSLAFGFFMMFFVIAIFAIIFCGKRMINRSGPISNDPETQDMIVSTSQGTSEQPEEFTGQESDSDAGSDYSGLSDRLTEKDVYRLPSKLTLNNLARKRSKVLAAKTHRYLWHLYTVSVFYALPVIQLVFTYQGILNHTGNQDLCYYNFLCAHPFGYLSDFNHVYSNIGYVLLGILFLILVRRRHRRYNMNPSGQELGIPQHFGLFYSMGGALIMEGVLSASYHVCPNKMNFQFDSSFMYVIAVLCMIKIYQTRHPDINARAHSTFSVLALIIFIGLVGVMNANLYFWIVFTVVHIVTCFLLTLKIYYMGRFKFVGVFSRVVLEIRRSRTAAIRPNYVARMIMLLIANFANWMLAAYGVYQHKKDFAVHLLAILMGNTILYTLFYIVMKLVSKERIRWHAWFFFIGSNAAWFSSLYLFLNSRTKWSLTPAESRRYNAQCELLDFYDTHDIWHFLSAVAMFLSFNLLLTLDDGMANTPRELIKVF